MIFRVRPQLERGLSDAHLREGPPGGLLGVGGLKLAERARVVALLAQLDAPRDELVGCFGLCRSKRQSEENREGKERRKKKAIETHDATSLDDRESILVAADAGRVTPALAVVRSLGTRGTN